MKYSKFDSNYDKTPVIEVPGTDGRCVQGWEHVCAKIGQAVESLDRKKTVVAIECYTGVFEDEVLDAVSRFLPEAKLLHAQSCFHSQEEIEALVAPFNGDDDPVFGRLTNLRMEDFLDRTRVASLREVIDAAPENTVVVVGAGASLVHPGDLLVYADLARWEAQLRMRRNAISNLGCENLDLKWSLQYKRAYFTDWRVCDLLKRDLMQRWDLVLDSNVPGSPRLADGEAVRAGLQEATRRPFRVPYPSSTPGLGVGSG